MAASLAVIPLLLLIATATVLVVRDLSCHYCNGDRDAGSIASKERQDVAPNHDARRQGTDVPPFEADARRRETADASVTHAAVDLRIPRVTHNVTLLSVDCLFITASWLSKAWHFVCVMLHRVTCVP